MQKKLINTAIISYLLCCTPVFAQDEDLLKLVGEEKPKKEFVKYAFKSPRKVPMVQAVPIVQIVRIRIIKTS